MNNKYFLILTALLHFCVLGPSLYIIKYSNIIIIYNIIILLASTFSVLWHLDETNKIIMHIDYLLAFIWFSVDIYIAFLNLIILLQVILLNLLILFLNMIIKKDEMYYIYHSIWHIISSIKCLYIVHLFINFQ